MNKLLCLTAVLFFAATTATYTQNKEADNTQRNKSDQAKEAVTPQKQSNKPEHIKITQAIRKAVVSDKALSTNAKNVKIVTTDSAVTLRGIVQTAEEKKAIAAYAKQSAGSLPVNDLIELK
jgi:osmotically-inducible protein OsmY